ncbi:MAG: hypothetical protein H7329_13880 [Opitutaceae bacterium]|nr:hypothetical protein [Cytophagales bacterium]
MRLHSQTYRIVLKYLIIFFLLNAKTSTAQFVSQWSLDALRIGIDPIKSWSMLSHADKHMDRPVYFNHTEGFVEFLVHQRTSIVFEAGYSNSNWNLFKNTLFYNSSGTYYRLGFDFNVSEPDPNYEVDLGWRIGVNSFKEKARLALHGDYWNQNVDEHPLSSQGSTYWGEVVLDIKYRVFKNSENKYLKNLWFNTSFRFRFKQNDLKAEVQHQYYMLPGYGFNSRYFGGINFGLSYFLKIRERKIYTIHHLHDNKVLLHHR